MKKNIVAMLLVLVVAFSAVGLAGCNNSSNDEDTLTIYTTFYPIYDLTKKVVGDTAKVVNLVGTGENAHYYELTSAQMVALEDKADVVIMNGLDMEHFMEDVSENILNKTYEASEGIATLEISASKTDPHLWVSIKNAKQMMENIKNHLVTVDSENANIYETNYNKYAVLFDGLDNMYTQAAQNFTSKNFVVSHKAFGYMARDYGLTQIAISGLESDDEANPSDVADIIDQINDEDIKVVFYQEKLNSTIASAITDQTDATIDILYTLSSLTKDQIDAGEDYLSLMAANLVALINALS